ncbi:MAG TPA: adenylate kinase [Polyangia bacterium]|jgi:adenylate kinase
MGEKLLLFGPPGVGKGTQAARLAATLRIPHISTGDMLRASIQSRTPLGNRVRELIEAGHFVSDETILEVVGSRLAMPDAQRGYILDGFPRTVSQAQSLAEIVGGSPPSVDAVVVLDAPAEALVQRLSGRRICESCQASYHLVSGPPKVTGSCDRCGGALIQRADDAEDTVRFRQKEYLAKTEPVLDYFKQNGWPVQLVDALGDIDQIFGRIYAAIWRD